MALASGTLLGRPAGTARPHLAVSSSAASSIRFPRGGGGGRAISLQVSFPRVCDPKSLLFMFGMELDYSDALIGGGFNFQNPNATKTCGCGKSFATSKETESAATACNN
ncbi:unnamed protein product [Urochloa humidicola]